MQALLRRTTLSNPLCLNSIQPLDTEGDILGLLQAATTSATTGDAAQPSSDGEVDQVEASFKEAAHRLKQQQAEAAMPIEDKLNM